MSPFIPDDAVTQVVLAIMAGAGGLKVWLRMKGDVRNDGIGIVDKKSHDDIAGTYSKLVLDLQHEVKRLAIVVADMSTTLELERSARHSAERLAVHTENKADALMARVAHLEQVLIKHGISF